MYESPQSVVETLFSEKLTNFHVKVHTSMCQTFFFLTGYFYFCPMIGYFCIIVCSKNTNV